MSDRSDVARCRSRSRKATSQMTRAEMARVVAENRGYLAGPGGWLYTADGRLVCQGYEALAESLGEALVPGRGIDWAALRSRGAR
jgi:hypothetical protein